MAIESDAMSSDQIESEISNYLFPEDVEKPSEEETVETPEVEAEAVETTDEVKEESSEENTEVEEDEGEEEDSSERWMPESLDDLAAAMEVEPDDLKSIRVKTKVDGVEGEATLADVIKNYQLNKSLTERSEAFAHEKKQLEESTEQLKAQYAEKISNAEAVTQMVEERLKNEIGAIDWEQLRIDDPANYAVMRQDYMEKIGEIESMKSSIVTERQNQMAEQQKKFQEQQAQVVQQNQEKLLAKVPEWSDKDTRVKEIQELHNYMRSQDISDQEINSIVDYRMVLMARKAKAYDEMQTKAQPAKAKAKTKPKFTKPGAFRTKQKSESAVAKKRIQRAAKTQNVDDWSKVLEDRLFS